MRFKSTSVSSKDAPSDFTYLVRYLGPRLNTHFGSIAFGKDAEQFMFVLIAVGDHKENMMFAKAHNKINKVIVPNSEQAFTNFSISIEYQLAELPPKLTLDFLDSFVEKLEEKLNTTKLRKRKKYDFPWDKFTEAIISFLKADMMQPDIIERIREFAY